MAGLKSGHTDTNYTECSGCPNLTVVSGNIIKVHNIVLTDCKLKSNEVPEELEILEGMQCSLTVDWEQKRVDISEFC